MFNFDLLTKYDSPCPRYTSYPTVPHFDPNFLENDFQKEMQLPSDQDVSLYFHIPFCEKLCYYCACNMIITHNKDYMKDYLNWLCHEIDMISAVVGKKRKVVQIHFGGGSPSYLPCEQLEALFSHIYSRFNVCSDAEISIEVDPRNLTPDHLPSMFKMGCNRISMGIQDLNKQVQEAVNRVYDESIIHDTFETARRLGFHSVNVDLMYGLPHQTQESFSDTVNKIIELDPDRVAAFHYAHVPWMKKHQELIKEETLPKAKEKWKMIYSAIEQFEKADYVYIGLDHFAKKTDSLAKSFQNEILHRNFQGYTTNGNVEIYAMGVSAISQLKNSYAQNVKTIKEYKEILSQNKLPISIGYRMTPDDQLRRDVIMQIMCKNSLIKSKIEEKYNIVFDEYFADALKSLDDLQKDGLIIHSSNEIKIQPLGRLFIRNIAKHFDRYFVENTKNVYSKSV